jgi:DNA-binding MarR family transcriptional regulator
VSEDTRLANQAWEALFTAQSRLLRQFQGQDAFAEVGMSEYDVLYTLSKQDGPVRMGELGCSVLLSQPGLSRLVDRLVRRGLVERCPDPADGRSVLVRLTAAGRTAQKQVGRRHARHVAEAMSVLDEEELRQLRTLATKLASEQSGTDPFGSRRASEQKGSVPDGSPTLEETA